MGFECGGGGREPEKGGEAVEEGSRVAAVPSGAPIDLLLDDAKVVGDAPVASSSSEPSTAESVVADLPSDVLTQVSNPLQRASRVHADDLEASYSVPKLGGYSRSDDKSKLERGCLESMCPCIG